MVVAQVLGHSIYKICKHISTEILAENKKYKHEQYSK